MADRSRIDSDAALTRSIEAHARRSGVRAVLVWDSSGTVAWSTRTILRGQEFRLDPEVLELFEDGPGFVAEGGEHPAAVRPAGLLGNEIEVFTPIVTGTGEDLVVQAYVDPAALAASRGEIAQLVLPVGLAALLLFEGLALLAVTAVVRRIQEGRRTRIRMLSTSLHAVDQERRRLAHDLHDGIVQDLAATRYAIMGVARSLPERSDDDAPRRLNRIAELLDQELAKLRGLLGELVVPDVGSEPLATAMESLVERLVPPDLEWTVVVDPALSSVDQGTAGIVHRVVQEGIRNAVRHAKARSVAAWVMATQSGPEPRIQVLLEDDGVGIPRDASPRRGHYGLQLVGDLVRGLGGSMALEDLTPGTRLRVEWPMASAATDLGTPQIGASPTPPVGDD
jgi:signal transduction histidine kinase